MTMILIVDDSVSTRQIVSCMLKKAGYGVLEATDEHEALEKANRHEVHLVITDAQTPKADGLAFIRKLRAVPHYKFTPVLTLINASDPETKLSCHSSSAASWIVKPVDSTVLLATVTKALGKWH